jgi:DNA-binding GntR family transcriptional regulator
MSRTYLEDLIQVRNMVELDALRRSIGRGDDEWEARVVSSLYRVNKLEQTSSDAEEGRGDFDLAHKAFHHALLSACGSPRLLALHSSLFDQAYRYRRAMVVTFQGQRPHNDQHQRISELALARKADECCALMGEHLAFTFHSVYGEGETRGLPPQAAGNRRDAVKQG